MVDDKKIDGTNLVHSILLRHRITNSIAIPIVFIYVMYAISGGLGALSASWQQALALSLMTGGLVLVSVKLHEYLNHRLLSAAEEFLNNPDGGEGSL